MKSEWRLIANPVTIILGHYWRASRLTLLLVASIVFLSSIAGIAAPYVFSQLIDRLNGDRWPETIVWSVVAYAVLLGFSTALQNMSSYLSLMSSENLSFITATSFFERLLKKTVGFFVEHNPAEIQSARMRGQQALNTVTQLGLVTLIPGLTRIALTLTVLGAMISADVAAVVVVYGIVYIVFSYYANHWTRKYLDAAIKASQENARFVGNAMNAMETLRHFGAEGWMRSQFQEKALKVRDSWRQFSLGRISQSSVFGAALAAQFAITFWLLMPRFQAGELSVGDLVLFNALLLQLNMPFEMIGHAIDDLLRAWSNLLPFARMWSAEEEPEPPDGASRFSLSRGRIAFDDVSFAYEGGRGVEHVSFAVERGSITYLTGQTGSGKSTVFKLALKSIEPSAGRITADGIPLAEISRSEWFALIGVVPQDIMLLNDTLASNIVLGRERDEARLRKAAARAAIIDFIDALPKSFETTVGERGLKLSGGERQRIAIARALYAEPQILFLDEASSALDEATERSIMDPIRAIADEVTIIAITHRRSVIKPEDRVIRLADGKVLDEADASV